MKKIFSLLLSLILFTFLFTGVFALETVENERADKIFYVAPNGDDNNTGTEKYPFKSLEGAKSRVRSLLNQSYKGDITVIFKEGEYRFDKTVEMNASDSGVDGSIITYKAEEGANVVFKGSVPLDVSKFKMVTDKSILERIPEVARDYVGQLDLKQFGIISMPEFGGGGGGNKPVKYNDIYLDDCVQTNARYPNIGYSKINEIVDKANGVFRPAETNVTRWGQAKDVQIAGHISNTYAYDRTHVLEINPQERTLKIDIKRTTNGLTNTEYGFFVYNLLEEIDSPGEWFIDKETMILYYYPPHPLSDEALEISRLRDVMINMNSASNIIFDGISFSQTCNDVMNLKNCNNIIVRNCNFRNTGKDGIADKSTTDANLTIVNGNNNILVENNVFYEIGGMGVSLSGGDLKTLTPSGNKILNNHIYHYQTYSRYGYAIGLGGVGNVVEHNTIHDSPHGGISFGGNDHIIRYNELYDLCKESNDCGAIYSGRNLHQRGVEIAYNYIHDVDIMDETREHTGTIQAAVYYDDRLSGGIIHHNIIENCSRGVFLHGSSDMDIHDNIIIETGMGIGFSYTGTGHTNLYDEAFEVYNKYPAYSKYKGMSEEELYARREDLYPKGNVCYDNLFVNSSGQGVNMSENVYLGDGIDENKIYDNPVYPDFDGFEDREGRNYNIKSDSEILKEIPGLAEIDMSKIGMTSDTVEISETFRKTSPKNAVKNVPSTNTIFSWEILPKADRYRLVIATDPELKNRVYDEDVYYNIAIINILEANNTNYYWDVWGYSNSKDSEGEWVKSKGDAYLFTTSKYDTLDKLLLSDAIKEAEDIYSELSVGDGMGQCSKENINEYRVAIDRAISVNELKFGTQKDVDSATDELVSITRSMNGKRNVGYVGIEDMLSDSQNWNMSTSSDIEDGELIIKEGHATYKEIIDTYKVLKFKIKVDYNGGWMAFGIRQKSPGTVWSGGTGYFLAFKEKEFEYQRFKVGSGGYLQDNIPNEFIKSGEWHDVEIASCDVKNGVWNYLKIDEKIVLNTIDSNNYISDAALFQIYCFGNDLKIQVKPSDSIPTEFDKSIIPVGGNAGVVAVEPVTVYCEGLKLSGAKETDNGIIMNGGSFSSAEKLNGNEVFVMKMKFNLEDEKYLGFSIRAEEKATDISETKGYTVRIRNDKIVLERKNDDGKLTLASVKNRFITSGKAVNVEFGAYPTSDGMRVLFYVNNEKVFDYTDSYTKIDNGFITIHDNGLGTEILK